MAWPNSGALFLISESGGGVHDTVIREYLLVLTAIGVSLGAPAYASDSPLDHLNPPTELIVEHAEILVPGRPGIAAEGFLAIWNGTNKYAYVNAIRSSAFGSVSLLRTELRSSGGRTTPVDEMLAIPGHAELRMTGQGIFLALAKPLSPAGEAAPSSFTLVLDDGAELTVKARIVRSREALTRHHHAQGDVEDD